MIPVIVPDQRSNFPPDVAPSSTPTRREMALVAGTSAESKKTVGKCNITHRFGGSRRARKNFPLPRSLGSSRVRSRRNRAAPRLTLTRVYACGAVNISDSGRREYKREYCADGNVTVPSVVRGGSCHGQRQW